MRCPECKSTFRNRTVCPECRVALRPKILTVVAVIYFIFGGLDVISGIIGGSPFDIVSGLVTVTIAWFLLRMKAFAIGLAMLRAFVGIVIPLLVIFVFQGRTAPAVFETGDAITTIAVNVFLLLINLILGILLFSPPSWRAFRLAHVPMRELDRIVAREDAS